MSSDNTKNCDFGDGRADDLSDDDHNEILNKIHTNSHQSSAQPLDMDCPAPINEKFVDAHKTPTRLQSDSRENVCTICENEKSELEFSRILAGKPSCWLRAELR